MLRRGYIVRITDPAERDLLYRSLLEFFTQRGGHTGFNKSRRNRIAGDAARGNLARDRHGQADQAGFRRGVIGLPA